MAQRDRIPAERRSERDAASRVRCVAICAVLHRDSGGRMNAQTPSRNGEALKMDDRSFVGGYLEEMAAHQLAAGPFQPTLQDVQILSAAAKLLQSETEPRVQKLAQVGNTIF